MVRKNLTQIAIVSKVLHNLFFPIVAVIALLVFFFRGQTDIQFELIIVGVLFYIFFAFLHHHLEKSLTVEVILEYILIAALVLIVVQGLLI